MIARIVAAGAVLALGVAFGARAGDGSQRSDEQVCKARADALQITADMRDTYMRECLAGERLNRDGPPAK